MTHFDTFTGYGGFTISAQKHGIETIGFSEIDKYANQVLNYHFPNIKNYGDITKIDCADLSDFDLLTGGSPCQDLSVAGKQAGLSGVRSGLFFQFIRILTQKQPTYFIWENVKGALSSSNGWDFARVQIEMEQAGYAIQWVVLNAKDFGVPQNRERIFVIGTRAGSEREILPIRSGTKQALSELTTKESDASRVYDTNGIAKTLKGLGGGLGAKTGLYAIPNTDGNVYSLDANYWKGSNSPNKSRRSQIAIPVLTPDRLDKRQNGRRFKENGEPSFTLNTQDRHGVIVHNLQPRNADRPSLLKNKNAGEHGHLQRDDGVTYTVDTACTVGVEVIGNIYPSGSENGDVLNINGISKTLKSGETSTTGNGGVGSCNSPKIATEGYRIRRLTPLECERLMGLEDDWTSCGGTISDTQRYKMAGNGVVVNCVDYLLDLIKLSEANK